MLQDKIDDLLRRLGVEPELWNPPVHNRFLKEVRALFGDLKTAAAEQRTALGQKLNELKAKVEEQIARATVAKKRDEQYSGKTDFADSLPGAGAALGRRHPIYRTWDEIV